MFKKLLLILALLFSINLYAEHHEESDSDNPDKETTETEGGEKVSGDEK